MSSNENWLLRPRAKNFLRSRHLKDLVQKMVAEGGTSSHSARGDSLGIILDRLEEARCPYKLTAHPGHGYYVEVAAPDAR